VEELHSEFVLEAANLLADCGLNDMELAGSAAEVLQLGHREEVPHLADLHRSPH
jgi:hypothetical protein